ncbi:UNVERIFIED_CONTAM: Retrovirus-related Pol polyprotein from transposon RE2 [Sesamum calycinum]|uniref:Retrovirus-related Pol polyprotein from transposon RE2 n=1 Tax=Sesamum calycinum TaxID=2727403 RepID=A0AAW2SFK4_9LAMI
MSDINSDNWLEAMKSEIDSMGSNRICTLVDPPKGVKPIGCKWVYTRKLGANGEVTTFKAKLVAKSIRILLAIATCIAESIVIFCDNNGAIAQAKELRYHHRPKHILRRYHLLREMVSRGDVRIDRLSSAENTADPLTKPMSQIAHTQHLEKMGLRSMGDWL